MNHPIHLNLLTARIKIQELNTRMPLFQAMLIVTATSNGHAFEHVLEVAERAIPKTREARPGRIFELEQRLQMTLGKLLLQAGVNAADWVQPMKPYLRSPAALALNPDTKWNAQSREVRAMLGMSNKAKLPKTGIEARIVQGIKVWVEPAQPRRIKSGGVEYILKSSTHRVLAQCPRCAKTMSAGRLHQHVCIEEELK